MADTQVMLTREPRSVSATELTVDQRFAVVPEWVLDLPISDSAFRLYAVLARYGNSSGVRMPGRALLAKRARKSVDSVDRALRELTEANVLEIERRTDGGRHLTNRYHLRTIDPEEGGRTAAATGQASEQAAGCAGGGGGRAAAATPSEDQPSEPGDSRRAAATGGRTDAAGVAAPVRPNPEIPTETPSPTPTPGHGGEQLRDGGGEDPNQLLLAACGIADLDRYAVEVQRLRSELGQPSVRWSGPCLLAALQLAVKVRSWPAHAARQALLLVAADPRTRSPMRLAEAGPWWDSAARQALQRTPQEQAELDGLERLLADCDDRAVLQQEARRQLAAAGQPITRLSVARRAARLLENQTRTAAQPASATHLTSGTTAVRRSA